MSGHNVPYQLRPNKFVERQLFLDVLDHVRVWNGPSRYIYGSMGGRFLEDFKLVNDRFSIEHMISIELDETTCKRQEFNRLGFIECRHQTSADFIADLDRLTAQNKGARLIVWLDYASPNQRGEQLGEFRQLLSKTASGDVAKITLNANPQSYRRRASPLTKKDFDEYLRNADSETHKDFESYIASIAQLAREESGLAQERAFSLTDAEYEAICIGNLKDQLGEYLPSGGLTEDQLKSEAFAIFLASAVRVAALKGVEGSKLQVIPLSLFRYRDGEHQMVTVTVVIADDELAARIYEDGAFMGWSLGAKSWSDVHEINVPDLSIKERHHIEGLISSLHDATAIHGEIPFRFDKSEKVSR